MTEDGVHEDRIAIRLATRQSGDRFRFWYSPRKRPYIAVEPLGADGLQSYEDITRPDVQRGPELHGALLVDDDQHFTICGEKVDPLFLGGFARWLERTLPKHPALICLAESGAAKASIDVRDETELLGVDPAGLDVHHDESLWKDMVRPTVEAVSGYIGSAYPGQRLWFWLSDDPKAELPLLLIPVTLDPTLERLSRWIVHHAGPAGALGATGRCVLGRRSTLFRFISPDLDAPGLDRLAAWVTRHADQHRNLARLRDAQFARISFSGEIEELIKNDEIWHALPTEQPPERANQAASVLDELAKGEVAWFVGGFSPRTVLDLANVEEDPAGRQFAAKRDAFRHLTDSGVFSGTVSRISTQRLLVVSRDGSARAWRKLLETYRSAFPRHRILSQLAAARFVRVDGDRILEAAAY